MSFSNRFLCICLVFVSLASCASPNGRFWQSKRSSLAAEEINKQASLIRSWVEQEQRLFNVATPLMTANAELCGSDVTEWLGLYTADINTFGGDWRAAAVREFNLVELPAVIYDIKGAPAYQAGLRRGDVIVAINGKMIDPDANGSESFGRMLNDAKRVGYVDIEFTRDGALGALRVRNMKRCSYDAFLEDSDQINAYADGKRIFVSTPMLDFVKSDEELALIIAHEMAHNTLGHVAARQENILAGQYSGLLVDLLFGAAGINTDGEFERAGIEAGSLLYSQEYEREADYVAAYYLARAGFLIDSSLTDFWHRMAAVSPDSLDRRFTHPTMYQRSRALDDTLSEIEAKKALGVALLPTPKDHTIMAQARATTGTADSTEIETAKSTEQPEEPVDFNTPLEFEVEGEAGV